MLDEVADLLVELAGVLVLQVDLVLDTAHREGDLLTFFAEHSPVDIVDEFDNHLARHSSPDASRTVSIQHERTVLGAARKRVDR